MKWLMKTFIESCCEGAAAYAGCIVGALIWMGNAAYHRQWPKL